MATKKKNERVEMAIDLSKIGGAGESLYKDDVEGILTKLVAREGTYEVVDTTTGEVIERPNSWTAYIEQPNGKTVRFSWPTYWDENGEVQPWTMFAEDINLGEVAANRILIHLWRDEDKKCHLEIVEEEVAA